MGAFMHVAEHAVRLLFKHRNGSNRPLFFSQLGLSARHGGLRAQLLLGSFGVDSLLVLGNHLLSLFLFVDV